MKSYGALVSDRSSVALTPSQPRLDQPRRGQQVDAAWGIVLIPHEAEVDDARPSIGAFPVEYRPGRGCHQASALYGKSAQRVDA